jgi:SAM-dependent methyltransferase
MGDLNQVLYLRKFLPPTSGPVLEVGSKDYGSTPPFRKLFEGQEYVGLDMADGPGVDQVIDLVEGTGELPDNHFSLAICCSVLEHVTRPWRMADNITRLLQPGGRLYVSVPWVWRYHAYPDDYFRFSFRGIEQLFPDFTWEHHYYSTTMQGEFLAIKPDFLGIDAELGVSFRHMTEHRHYLPFLMVNMLGTKMAGTARAAA